MDGFNILAIIAAAAAAFFLGGFWYSKYIFGSIWLKANNKPYDQKRDHSTGVFAIAIVLYLVSAFGFAMLIGPQPEFYYAVKSGLEIGVLFVATSFAINYVFAGRGLKLTLIDCSYHILQFVIYGVVLGLWK